MDDFKILKHIGPGGAKCPCCIKASKKDTSRAARARLKVKLRAAVEEAA